MASPVLRFGRATWASWPKTTSPPARPGIRCFRTFWPASKQPLAYGRPSMVLATTAEVAPACLECGACCFSKLMSYVQVDGADHARIGDQVDELTVFDGNRCYMRMSDGH